MWTKVIPALRQLLVPPSTTFTKQMLSAGPEQHSDKAKRVVQLTIQLVSQKVQRSKKKKKTYIYFSKQF